MEWGIESVLLLVSLLTIINVAAATLCFGRITVRYLDRELLAQGVDMTEADGLGMRFPWYVLAILSNRPEHQPFVPGEAIMRLRRPKDIVLARWISWSFFLMMVLAIVVFLGCRILPGWDCE
ncbi:hypothetical protein [Alkalimonas amylolytica]|uniref:Uncharacterized protein n=1 Tax=Alkalimonas amylolytica TaxID=152573 RepID=A0A1H4EPG6_ALKAM|nr:hypothetical protein [Alkalimonas amylolytica]SEA86749.1 hypothetical protein SAMN04488051_107165 [Alkalimonas amylolytica]